MKHKTTIILYFSLSIYCLAQSDTIVFRNIGYLVKDKLSVGNLKLYKDGFTFKSNIQNVVFSQELIAVKKIKSTSDYNQVEFTDVALGTYIIEFETKAQANFLKKFTTSKKKKTYFSSTYLEPLAGEMIKGILLNAK